tara:strand:+ start:852 stop:1229 length:378 start_codon:yes stop_codon:yes gene_type:complete
MFDSAAGLGKVFRSEVIPMLKSKGFNLQVATTKNSYYHDGKINVTINKVPTNFPVWKSEYSRWDRTENADRLTQTIKNRIDTLIENNNRDMEAKDYAGLDIDVSVNYGSNIKYIPYEKDESNESN